MERIKKAIENAKNPELNGHSNLEQVDQTGKNKKTPRSPRTHQDLRNTIKLIIAVVLIVLAGWLWLRLDFMNQLELIASEYINDGIKLARSEAKKRVADEEKFKQLMANNLAHCQAAAESYKESYVKLVQDSVRIQNEKGGHDKKGVFVIPPAVERKADSMLEAAKVECKQIYDAQLIRGK